MTAFDRRTIGGLYLIADVGFAAGRDLIALTREAIAGGARVVQLRQKTGGKRQMLATATMLASLCREAAIPFLVNDHVDVALAVDADGVHVGQEDLPVPLVRRLLPPGKIVGCSAATLNEAVQAERDSADYLGVGSIFATSTKSDTRPAGLTTLRAVRAAVGIPIIAIGGLSSDNAGEVIAAGADGVAVISAVLGAPDVRAAAEQIASLFTARRPS